MSPTSSSAGAVRIRTVSVLLCGSALFLLLATTFAVCADRTGTPQSLREWIPWVLYNQESKTCTLRSDDITRRYCTWPSRLSLELFATGAVFSQEWSIETEAFVPLPGSRNLWPESVRDGGRNLIVLDRSGTPMVRLQPGRHILSGRFGWQHIPESITLPSTIGLVGLKNRVADIHRPFVDTNGILWLKTAGNKALHEVDRTSIQVFRKIMDTIPLQEEIHIVLTVSGTPREIPLGLMVKDGFLPLRITSPLPTRIDRQGRLVVQARPGQWSLDMLIRNTRAKPPEKLEIGAIDGPWPQDEIWVFASSPELRRVRIENVQSIDPSRTGLPTEWMTLPAYFMKRRDTMHLVEKQRGNPRTQTDRLSLTRTLWLDETGSGMTALDAISGTMTKEWRLSVVPEQHLGKVDIDGISQLITRLSGSDQSGIEVRRGNISLTADSRIEEPVRRLLLSFPALGWDHQFQHLSARLNLPPGWKLLTASGVDKIPTWLNRWTLLDIFLVLIITLATGKIFGWRWGGLAFLTLVLIYHQPQSPRYLWLPLLALLAIGSKLTSEKAKVFIRIPLAVFMVLLLLQSVPFMVREIRIGIFPQLEMGPSYRPTTGLSTTAQDAATLSVDKARRFRPNAALLSSKKSELRMSAPQPAGLPSNQTDNGLQSDPGAMIQTGPGLPDWRWRTLPLTWNGPVGPDQHVRLVLLPPWLNCILAFSEVALLCLLVVGFLQRSSSFFKIRKADATSVFHRILGLVFIILLCHGIPTSARAEMPSPEILQELQNRLLSPPACGNECASLDSALLSGQDDQLFLDLTIHAFADTAVPLPGDIRTFSAILVDNTPAGGLRTDSGILLIRLPAGIHHVRLEKGLHGLKDLSLTFPLVPHRARAAMSGWTISGIHPDQTMDNQISLKRIATGKRGTQDVAGPGTTGTNLVLPPFFQVIRTLHLGLKWTVDTQVVRKSPGNSITAEVPMIDGEMPTTEPLYISAHKVQVNLGPHDSVFSWHSVLPQTKSLTLHAARSDDRVETWYLDISPIWHVAATGFPEVSESNQSGLRFPEYRPYPGESLTLSISRPEGVPGPTMTIDSSSLQVQPGIRATDCTLVLHLHASRGMDHVVTLPHGVELLKVLLGNNEYQAQITDGRLHLPIRPGKQSITIRWRSRDGISTTAFSPKVDLGLASVNATLHMQLPFSRWILLTGGPRIGPAVLFWGELLVIILLALLLGRTRRTPLSSLQWFLLGIGLSQVSVIYGAFVVGWLFLLDLRKSQAYDITSPLSFNFFQIALVAATVLACFSLLYAVQRGLLGYPDMQIGGNGSLDHALIWYQDRTPSVLPRAWVVSVPLFVYRIMMLAWALWLSLALLRWTGWGWTCFSENGIWRKKAQVADEAAGITGVTEELSHQFSIPIEKESADTLPPVPDRDKPPGKRSWFLRLANRVKGKRVHKKDE